MRAPPAVDEPPSYGDGEDARGQMKGMPDDRPRAVKDREIAPGGRLAMQTVLLVEDDVALGTLVSGLLSDAGYRPVTIADHADIAAAVAHWQPRCVILDGELIAKGQERSWDDAIAIRRAHPGLPVLMFTADATSLAEAVAGTSSRSRAAAFAGVVGKPFVVDQFLATVHSAIEAPVTPAAQVDDRILAVTLFPEVASRQTEGAAQIAILSAIHDLRTPLTSVSGQIQLAKRHGLRDPEVLSTALDRAMVQVARMDRLIGELLDRSRVAAGAITLEIAAFDLSPVVAEVVAQHDIGEVPHIAFEAPEQPVIVRGDRSRVAQIVGDLLINALKYSPIGSPIRVSLGVVRSEALVLIEDQGLGVPADEHQRIFEPYQRSSRVRDIRGTGLGLHISRRLAERHGGRLWLERSTEGGSVFALALPIAGTQH